MAEILKEDAVRNSFIANINLLVQKMTLLAEVNNKFTDEEVDALVDLVAYDLQVIIDDLMKGTHNGKRKIDINLIKNLVDYKDTMSDDEKLALWSLSSNLVGYTGATIKLINGIKFDIEFDTEVFSNNDLYHQFNRNTDFRNLVTGTEWLWSLEDITGGIVRFVDLVTITESDESDEISNLESITLIAHQVGENKYKEARPVYTWVDFTSALQLVAANINYIMDLLAKYPDFVHYGRLFEIIVIHLEQLLLIHEHMNELVLADDSIYNNIDELKTIYSKITQIVEVYDNLTQIVGVYDKLSEVITVYDNLSELNVIYDNISELKTIFDNIDKLTGTSGIYSKLHELSALYTDLDKLLVLYDNLDHIPEDLQNILESVETINTLIDNLRTLTVSVESISYDEIAESEYDLNTNNIHFRIPEGKPGADSSVQEPVDDGELYSRVRDEHEVNGRWEKSPKPITVNIVGSLDDVSELPTTPDEGKTVYFINGHIWVYNWNTGQWEDQGVVQGVDGKSATIEVGSVNHVEYDHALTIINVGTELHGIFNFEIPKGMPGNDGKDGKSIIITGGLTDESQLPDPGNPGDMYIINKHLWVWNNLDQKWEDQGEVIVSEGGGTVEVPDWVVTSDGTVSKIISIKEEDFFALPEEEQNKDDVVYLIESLSITVPDPDDESTIGDEGLTGEIGDPNTTITVYEDRSLFVTSTGIYKYEKDSIEEADGEFIINAENNEGKWHLIIPSIEMTDMLIKTQLPKKSKEETAKKQYDILKASATLIFGSVSANTSVEKTIVCTRAKIGDIVQITNIPNSAYTKFGLHSYVSAVDTVTIRITNTTTASINPANVVWEVAVFSEVE